jgi:hypothetical protein
MLGITTKHFSIKSSMKTPSIAFLNNLGLQNPSQKAALAAHFLKAGTVSSPAVVVVPAVVANPTAVPPVTAKAAISTPVIVAVPGWHDAIEFAKTADSFKIVAYLPCVSGGAFAGKDTGSIDNIKEMTPAALQPTLWVDFKASATPEALVAIEPLTLEKYFYKQALAIVAAPNSTSKIENAVRMIGTNAVACKKVTLNISANNYTLGVEALQLGKLG